MTDLAAEYQQRYERVLVPLALAVEVQLREYCEGQPRIDSIQARAKTVDRFLAKAAKTEGGSAKYAEPLHQIQDQVGARIVVLYLSDVQRLCQLIERYFHRIETRVVVPDTESEFGYFGQHYILIFPTALLDNSWDKTFVPDFFELQVKTLFQHAWSEADHDLGYKPGDLELSSDAKRRIAFTAAQAWGADRIFNELFRELRPS